MDNFDKLMSLRSLLEHMGLPKVAGYREILDTELLFKTNVVKAYPEVRRFLEKMNDVFPNWNYSTLNQVIPKLSIDSYFYNETEAGKQAVQAGEVSDLDLTNLELKVINPEDTNIIFQHLLQLMVINVYEVKNYNVMAAGVYLKLIITSTDPIFDYKSIQIGRGLNEYLSYYILNKYLDVPINLPEGIEAIYDLIFDLLEIDNIGLVNSGNPFLIIDEFLKYMDQATVKIIYDSFDNLIQNRKLLLEGKDARSSVDILKYQELQENMESIQDLLLMALETKNAKKRTYNI